MNIIGAALEQLVEHCNNLSDFLTSEKCADINIPDDVWVKYCAALSFAEKSLHILQQPHAKTQ